MSPKSKRERAREHLETAREDLEADREKDVINALFYAAEAAAVALGEQHGIDTKQRHWLKADAVTDCTRRAFSKRTLAQSSSG